MESNLKITINGIDRDDLILVGDLEKGGPIATKEQIENAEKDFGHLHTNGEIINTLNGQVVANVKDINIEGYDYTEVGSVSYNGLKGRNPIVDMLVDMAEGLRKEGKW